VRVSETLSSWEPRVFDFTRPAFERDGTKDVLIDDPISRQLYLGERFKM